MTLFYKLSSLMHTADWCPTRYWKCAYCSRLAIGYRHCCRCCVTTVSNPQVVVVTSAVNARSHGATATAKCIKNCHKMALYPAMMGLPVTVDVCRSSGSQWVMYPFCATCICDTHFRWSNRSRRGSVWTRTRFLTALRASPLTGTSRGGRLYITGRMPPVTRANPPVITPIKGHVYLINFNNQLMNICYWE